MVIPLIEINMAIKKNLENFSFRNIKENKITTIGAKLDKNVALETVVSLIDQCQQIKSNEKKIPEIKIIKTSKITKTKVHGLMGT